MVLSQDWETNGAPLSEDHHVLGGQQQLVAVAVSVCMLTVQSFKYALVDLPSPMHLHLRRTRLESSMK